MAKRLILLIAIIAATAAMLPITASASSITSSAGKFAPVGAVLTATNSDFVLTSSVLGTITCSKVDFKWTLTKNDGETVEGSGSNKEPVQEGCNIGPATFKITTLQISKLVAAPTGGSMSFVLTTDYEGASKFDCTLTGTNVPFTYTAGSDTITFTSATGVNGGPCGTYKLDASFTIEIGSTPVILD
jgi:hypothetical protein